MPDGPISEAIVFSRPGRLDRRRARLRAPRADEVLVDVEGSGISTGTERLLWRGTMPTFPGLGYPLVPGYEAVGTVREAGRESPVAVGARVFVPGTDRWEEGLRGLFGASASTLLVEARRVAPIGDLPAERGVALALAATAMHTLSVRAARARPDAPPALAALAAAAPELIVGHGALGRLLARIVVALGAPPPLVWETRASRRDGALGYAVIDPADDEGGARARVTDVSGAGGDHLDRLIAALDRGGRLTLAGFYESPLAFSFPAAFRREVSLEVAAEWTPADLAAVLALIEADALDLGGIVSDVRPAEEAEAAYARAFDDPHCLKMMLRWSTP